MERKEFLKSLCAAGGCSCLGFSLLPTGNVKADETEGDEENQTVQFMQRRFAKLLNLLDGKLDEADRNEVIMGMGKACSKDFEASYLSYKNDLDGLKKMMKEQWKIDLSWNEETRTFRSIGHKTDKCVCPFVDAALTPTSICNCSLGFHVQLLETLFEKKFEAKVLESVLRGGERCSFEVRVLA